MKKRFLAVLLCMIMLFVASVPMCTLADETLTLPDYSDNEILDNGNLIKDPDNLNHLKNPNGQAGTIVEAVEGSHITWQDKDVPSQSNIAWMAGPTYLAYKSNGALKYHFADGFGETTGWTVGETFVYSVRLKNSAPDKDPAPYFGMSFDTSWTYRNQGSLVYYQIENTEYETYSGYYTSPVDTSVLSLGFTCLTRPYKAKGGRISMDISNGGSLMVAKVAPTQIVSEIVGDAAISKGATTTIKTDILNQIGEKDYVSQDVTYTVLNKDRTEVSDGLTVEANGDGTATVTAVKEGVYVVLAQQGELRKGVEILVTPYFMTDSELGEDPLYEVKLTYDGDTDMGVFDVLDITAEVVDSEGNAGTNAQQFAWYLLNEDRTIKVTDVGVNLEVSEDTKSVSVSLDTDAKEDTYYIIAESTAEESLAMLKGLKIKADKSGTITDIIKAISTKPVSDTEEKLDVYMEILGISEDYVTGADKNELATILYNGADEETLENADDLCNYFKRASLTTYYNIPTESVVLFKEDGTHNFESELGIDKIDDEDKGVTLYAAAFAEMSEAGKLKYRSSLTGKGFATYGSLMDAIKKNLILKSIANPKDDGVAYLDTIITEENLKLFDIEADEYFALEGSAKKAFKKEYLESESFETIQDLADTLKKAEDYKISEDEEEEDDDNKSSGGGNKVSFGGGSSGGVSAGKKEEPIKDEIKLGTDFTDVPSDHWAAGEIHYLRNIGVINGTTETTYSPDASVTREQFLKLIIEAFKIGTSNATSAFSDASPEAWYTPYIVSGVEKGIVNGKSESVFGVGESITRQDACVMIDRALSLSKETNESLSFKDAQDIADYAKASVAVLSSYGVVNGVGANEFNPGGLCTRAQAAKIIANMLSVCNSLGIGR